MSGKVIQLRPRPLRPLAKAKPLYPEPDDGVSLTVRPDGGCSIARHSSGFSMELAFTEREMWALIDEYISARRGQS
jgi:hypothetical protein